MSKTILYEGVDPKTGSDRWYHEKEMGMIKSDNSEVSELRQFLVSIGYTFPPVVILQEKPE